MNDPNQSLHVLAADLGGTNLRVALVDRQGSVTNLERTKTNASDGRGAVIKRLISLLKYVSHLAPNTGITGIGLSVASPVDPSTGVMYNPPNLPGWDQFNINRTLEKHLDLPVITANDATLAALAEHQYGSGRGYSNIVYLTLSTGIGGGIVIGNNLFMGTRGLAGEFGHMTVDRNGPDCNCGNIGCLEVMASGSAIAQFARQRLRGGEESTMATEGDLHTIDAEIVANAARSGDNLAKEIILMAASNLGRGIVNIMHGLDPDIVILGGGLTKNLDLFMPTIIGEISNHAIKYQVETIPVVRSKLGDNISLLGASALAFTYYGKSDIKLQR